MPYFWAQGAATSLALVRRPVTGELSTKFSTTTGDGRSARTGAFHRTPRGAVRSGGRRRSARHNSRRPVQLCHLVDGKGHIAFDHTSRRLADLATPHLLDRRLGLDHRTLLEPAHLARRSDPPGRRGHLGHARPLAGARRRQQAVAQLGTRHGARRRAARGDRRAANHGKRLACVVRVGRSGRRRIASSATSTPSARSPRRRRCWD